MSLLCVHPIACHNHPGVSLKDGALWPRSNPTLREWKLCLKTVGCPNSLDLSASISTICVPNKPTPETLSPQSQDMEWVEWDSMALKSNSRLRNQQIAAGALDDTLTHPPLPVSQKPGQIASLWPAPLVSLIKMRRASPACLLRGFASCKDQHFRLGDFFFLGVGLFCAPQSVQTRRPAAPSGLDNLNYLQTFSRVPWRTESPLFKNQGNG